MGKRRQTDRSDNTSELKEKRNKNSALVTETNDDNKVVVKEVDLPSHSGKSGIAPHIAAREQRLIVVLESANLETVKSGKGFGLLNVDEHVGILRKLNKDFSQARPDITHQCLLMLLDSPLNRAGKLQVFIHTANNVLIEVNPQTRIPRTFSRFAGLFVQLLHKFSVKASDSSIRLLKVIKNPITDHLPIGCKKVLMSYTAQKVAKPSELVPNTDEPVCVVIGAIAKGSIKVDYTEEDIRIGNFPLSAALTCTKLCSAFEDAWGIF
jgi:rRNA small subunit pseudouridine methyltransferase Nep1